MEQHNINSADDYAQLLIDTIIETEKENPEHEQMPINLLTYWVENIKEKVDETWLAYITGERDSYILTDKEMLSLYDEAGKKYASDLIDGMVDKEILETFVDENGDIVYGLSEKGKQMVIDDIMDNNGEQDNNKQ